VIWFLGCTRGWLRRGRRPARTGCHTRSVSTPARLVRAWCHALLGAAASVVAASLALIPAAVTPGPRAFQLATWFAAAVALLLAVGLPRASRRAAIRLANTLLGASVEPVPAGAGAAAGAGSTRVRSAVWLALHGLLGGAVALGAGTLVGAAVIALVGWAGAGNTPTFDYLWVAVPIRGWAGLVTLPFAAVHLVGAVLATLGYAALLRRLAPALLGPGAAERLAAERHRADVLAHRNRLARELHDSIGHTLTASTLQAAAAGRLLDTARDVDPQALRQALTAIEESSRAALDDLDQALAALRTDPADAPADRQEGRGRHTTPARTLADLPTLLHGLGVAGLAVDTTGVTDLTGLPEPVSREAYRIIQEGLTNALRYAEPATATLHLRVERNRLLIDLTNPTELANARAGAGRGLAGSAERVRLLRGDIHVGPADDQRAWRLTVCLPLAGA
jgi:signal transduction histidine kinase